MKRLITVLLTAATTLMLAGCNKDCETPVGEATPQQTYKWKLVTSWPKNFPGLGTAPERFAKEVEAKRPQLEKYENLCREIGHPPGEVALAWLLHNPVVTAPIIGPRTMEQLESAARAASIELDDKTMKKLDEIFPGPGGEAPNAYSW